MSAENPNASFEIRDASGKGVEVKANPQSHTVVVRIVGCLKTFDPSYVLTGQEAARLASALKHLASLVRS